MFDTLCTLSLQSDLFAQSLHPSSPLLAVGLSSGHVQAYKLPPPPGVPDSATSIASYASEPRSETSDGLSEVQTTWRTRRHKGSCRALGFSWDGHEVVSSGTDGLVKGALSEDGRVLWKVAVPFDGEAEEVDPPVLLHCLTPQTLLLATDSSALHLYDLRALQSAGSSTIKPHATYHAHDDYISSLTPMPPSSASTSGLPKQWLSTGGTTLALTDLRKGVVKRSEDQEEELLSSVYVTGLSSKGTSTGAKAVVGCADGVVTLWESGVWDDQDERITIDRGTGGGESLDAMVQVPEHLANGKIVAIGTGAGKIRFVRLGQNQVVDECAHDEIEGVVGLDFDVGGRMISGGGQIVKVWGERFDDSEDEDEPVQMNASLSNGIEKRAKAGSSDSEETDEEQDSSEEELPKKKRKKRKRNKGKQVNARAKAFSFKGLD